MQIGVFAFIENKNKKVLLVQDATREEKWTMPGGGLDFRETVTEGVVREIKEEIGVEATTSSLLGIFSQQKSPGIVILFECKISSENFVLNNNEVQNARYFSIFEIEKNIEKIKPAQYAMILKTLNKDETPIYSDFTI